MGKQLRRFAPLCALVLATCSWTTNFAVINHGHETIRVSFIARPTRTPPALISVKELEFPRSRWKELDLSAAPPDSAALTVSVGPDSALVLAEMGTYPGYNDADADWFEIRTLRIRSTFGERSYTGREVLRAFEKRSNRLYVIEFH